MLVGGERTGLGALWDWTSFQVLSLCSFYFLFPVPNFHQAANLVLNGDRPVPDDGEKSGVLAQNKGFSMSMFRKSFIFSMRGYRCLNITWARSRSSHLYNLVLVLKPLRGQMTWFCCCHYPDTRLCSKCLILEIVDRDEKRNLHDPTSLWMVVGWYWREKPALITAMLGAATFVARENWLRAKIQRIRWKIAEGDPGHEEDERIPDISLG